MAARSVFEKFQLTLDLAFPPRIMTFSYKGDVVRSQRVRITAQSQIENVSTLCEEPQSNQTDESISCDKLQFEIFLTKSRDPDTVPFDVLLSHWLLQAPAQKLRGSLTSGLSEFNRKNVESYDLMEVRLPSTDSDPITEIHWSAQEQYLFVKLKN